jgi:hypothetical protein
MVNKPLPATSTIFSSPKRGARNEQAIVSKQQRCFAENNTPKQNPDFVLMRKGEW